MIYYNQNYISVIFSRFYRDFRPTSMEKSQESLRLRIYEVYAWGMPIVITTVAAVLDNLPESPTDAFLRPRFGENKCWFYGEFLISFINLISFSKASNNNNNKQ